MAAFGILLDRSTLSGTVQPFPNFDPAADAHKLLNAVKGLGTDEATIIKIFTSRSSQQLREIEKAFKAAYHMNLQTRLLDELAEPVEWPMRMLVAMRVKTQGQRDAEFFKWALFGAGTDEMALIELFGTRSYEELGNIWPNFGSKERFLSFIRDDVAPSPFLTFLLYFNDPPNMPEISFEEDVKSLVEGGPDAFAKLFACRDFEHMSAVLNEFEKRKNRTFEDLVQRDTSGLYREALQSCAMMARNIHSYFAKRLFDSMRGPGTNNAQLIRVVVSRCEVDMVQIKMAMEQMYRATLAELIKDDTSGYFKSFLLGLIGY